MKKKVVLLVTVMTVATAMSMTAYAGSWKQDATGWWWQNDDGSYPVSKWEWLDGNNDGVAESYCFDARGYMYADTVTPDNYTVNKDGQWTVNGVVQTKNVGVGAGVGTQVPAEQTQTTATQTTGKRYMMGKSPYDYGMSESEAQEALAWFDALKQSGVGRGVFGRDNITTQSGHSQAQVQYILDNFDFVSMFVKMVEDASNREPVYDCRYSIRLYESYGSLYHEEVEEIIARVPEKCWQKSALCYWGSCRYGEGMSEQETHDYMVNEMQFTEDEFQYAKSVDHKH